MTLIYWRHALCKVGKGQTGSHNAFHWLLWFRKQSIFILVDMPVKFIAKKKIKRYVAFSRNGLAKLNQVYFETKKMGARLEFPNYDVFLTLKVDLSEQTV